VWLSESLLALTVGVSAILIVTWSVQPNREPVEERVIGERSVVPMPQFAVVGLLVATLYLLHPAIQGANFYNFHELAFAPLLFFAAAYALEKDSSVLLWTSALLLLLVKEDCAFVVGGLGTVAL